MNHTIPVRRLLQLAAFLCLPFLEPHAHAQLVVNAGNGAPIPVRFVVVTTFDTGGDTDAPGEFNTWVVNFPLPVIIPFPQGYHHLRYNAEKQVLGIESGEGPTHMAASITALANDSRLTLAMPTGFWLASQGPIRRWDRRVRRPGRNTWSTVTSLLRLTRARSHGVGAPVTCPSVAPRLTSGRYRRRARSTASICSTSTPDL